MKRFWAIALIVLAAAIVVAMVSPITYFAYRLLKPNVDINEKLLHCAYELEPGVWPMFNANPQQTRFADCEIGNNPQITWWTPFSWDHLWKRKIDHAGLREKDSDGEFDIRMSEYLQPVTSKGNDVIIYDIRGFYAIYNIYNGTTFHIETSGYTELNKYPKSESENSYFTDYGISPLLYDNMLIYLTIDNTMYWQSYQAKNHSYFITSSYQLENNDRFKFPCIQNNNTYYIGRYILCAFDNNQKLIWKKENDNDQIHVLGVFTIDQNNNCYIKKNNTLTHESYIVSYDNTGSERWRSDEIDQSVSQLSCYNDVIYALTNNNLRALSDNDNIIWTFYLEDSQRVHYIAGMCVDAEGNAFFVSYTVENGLNTVFSVDCNGNKRWATPTTHRSYWFLLVSANGLLIALDLEGTVEAFSSADGSLLWSIDISKYTCGNGEHVSKLGEDMLPQSCAVDSKGTLYVAASDLSGTARLFAITTH